MKKRAKRKISAAAVGLQSQFTLGPEGQFFNLQEIFHRLNDRHFQNRLQGYTIVWGRRRKLRPRTYFVYATIQEEDKIIRVHPLLDASFVPVWLLEYVIFHEMLHAVVPDVVYPSGRRRVHTDEFTRLERKFPHFHRAQRWEKENLGRFLR